MWNAFHTAYNQISNRVTHSEKGAYQAMAEEEKSSCIVDSGTVTSYSEPT